MCDRVEEEGGGWVISVVNEMGQKKIVIIRVVREKNREGVRKNSIVIAIRFLVPFGSAMLLRRTERNE